MLVSAKIRFPLFCSRKPKIRSINQDIFPAMFTSTYTSNFANGSGEMAIDLLMNRERGESAVKVMYKKLQIQKAFFFFLGGFWWWFSYNKGKFGLKFMWVTYRNQRSIYIYLYLFISSIYIYLYQFISIYIYLYLFNLFPFSWGHFLGIVSRVPELGLLHVKPGSMIPMCWKTTSQRKQFVKCDTQFFESVFDCFRKSFWQKFLNLKILGPEVAFFFATFGFKPASEQTVVQNKPTPK